MPHTEGGAWRGVSMLPSFIVELGSMTGLLLLLLLRTRVNHASLAVFSSQWRPVRPETSLWGCKGGGDSPCVPSSEQHGTDRPSALYSSLPVGPGGGASKYARKIGHCATYLKAFSLCAFFSWKCDYFQRDIEDNSRLSRHFLFRKWAKIYIKEDIETRSFPPDNIFRKQCFR